MKHQRLLPFLLAALVLLILPACNKNKTGTLEIQFVPKVGTEDLTYGQEYTNGMGQAFKMSLLRYYVSQVTLLGDEQQHFPDQYFSVDLQDLTVTISEVPKDQYTGLSFGVGVDQSANHSDPTTFDINSPLNPANAAYQHWDWNSGYIFIKLEGQADTTNNGVADANFTYHIGTDDLYKSIALYSDITIAKGMATIVQVEVDVATILDQVDFKSEIRTHTDLPTLPLATKISDNLLDAFKVVD